MIKTDNLWVKILVSIIISLAMAFGGFVAMVIAALTRGNFYVTIVALCDIVIWLYTIMQIWNLFKPRIRNISVGAAVGLIILVIAGFEINRAYVNSIDEINEQGVNLSLYEPFKENTKAVSLNVQSSFKMTDNLPKIDGATALYPLYSAFARAVYPENDYPSYPTKEDDYVICTNTDGAYRGLITGNSDIIFVAEPSDEQLQMAKDKGVELKLTPIGREAFVFFVNIKNSVNDLSISDIQKIYSGKAKNWSEFGGKDTDIRAFQRPVNSGSQTALIKFMGDIPLMTPPGEDVVDPMGGIFTRVSSYKNYNSAIGYSFLFFTTQMVNDNKIKLLSINGVVPTRENVANKTYPYASEFYAVTAGTENPNVEKFIEWILTGEGRYLVDKTGYTPLIEAEKAVYKKITQGEAKEMMNVNYRDDKVTILDVRTQEEFDEGHIINAILLPDYEISDRAQTILHSKSETILVYCRTGRRSEITAKELVAMGYTNVYDFGGILDWTGEIVR